MAWNYNLTYIVSGMARTKKYLYEDRKRIAARIQGLRNQEDCFEIYELISADDEKNFTQGSSGVHLELTRMSNKLLARIERRLDRIRKRNEETSDESEDEDVIPISVTSRPKRAHKRSNYEEGVLRQRRLKALD